MTEPTRPSTTGRAAPGRSGDVNPGAAVGAAMLDDLLAQGHLADIDRHFAALVAGLDGGGGPELPLAAALASAWARDGHACIALPEVAGRDWPRAGGSRLPDLEAWIGALAASPVVAGPGDAERRPLVLDDRGRLYLERLWTAERTVAADLRRLAHGMESTPGSETGPDDTESAPGSEAGPDDTESTPGSEAGPDDTESTPGSEAGPGDTESTPGSETGPDDTESTPGADPSAESAPGMGAGADEERDGQRFTTGAASGLLGLPGGLEAALDRLFPGTASGDRARTAARTAVTHRLCVVSGGPGTGKTTIAATIVALLIELRLAAPGRIALAAPTGKAAARLQEAVRGRHRDLVSRVPALEGYEAHATTVHRWLFSRARNRRPVDALILDEGSMVDLTLMAKVLAALPDGARLVVLGDASQLASVQPGAVFADVCRAGAGAGTIELGLAAPGRIALAAPTGKAAARLREAVRGRHRDLVSRVPALEGYEANATTVHRWLFSRARDRRPVDALILDEGSMVDLTLMAKVLAALPDGARLVVLGDASQLASVQPGAVFADVCRAGAGAGTSPLAPCVVELVHNWRFDEAGGIGRLAGAVVRGDATAAVAALRDPSDDATELRPLADAGRFEQLATDFADEWFAPAVREIRALRGPGEGGRPLSAFRVLCAHRVGPFGAERFNRSVERRLRALGLVRGTDTFYPGRPILVTRNDPRTGLSNGDTGVVLRDADDRVRVWFPELADTGGRHRLVTPARLPPHESFFAVTVHRAQGSEYEEVAVVLGPSQSRVTTRELLYTAVTRARRRVVVHGSEASVEAAVERATERSSGLRDALWSRSLTTRGRSPARGAPGS